jgi:hypothetical protein
VHASIAYCSAQWTVFLLAIGVTCGATMLAAGVAFIIAGAAAIPGGSPLVGQ